jgi:hypothetical protein
LFCLSSQLVGVIIFITFDIILKFSGQKCIFVLHLVEIYPDPTGSRFTSLGKKMMRIRILLTVPIIIIWYGVGHVAENSLLLGNTILNTVVGGTDMQFYCSTVQIYCYFAFAVNPSQNRLVRPKIYLALSYR